MRPSLFVLVVLGVLPCAAIGCRRTQTIARLPNVEGEVAVAPSACDRFAQTLCRREDACRPGRLRSIFGDVARCIARETIRCDIGVRAPSSGMNEDALATCDAALDAMSCDSLVRDEWPEKCVFHGGLKPGDLCAHDAQCTTGDCSGRNMFLPNPCFRCVEPGAEGDTCSPLIHCARGFVCIAKGCTKRIALGDECAWLGSCGAGAACVKDDHGTMRCARTARAGERCSDDEIAIATAPPCEDALGLVCVNGKCESVRWVGAGEKCDFSSSARCLAGECGFEGCRLPPNDGEKCEFDCVPPADCLSGKCALPDPARCVVKP